MAQTIYIDLSLTVAQRNALRNALTTLETMVDSTKYQTLLWYWNRMDEETRAELKAGAPLFARLLALVERLPRE